MSTPADGVTLIRDLGERELIARIRRRLPPPPPTLLVPAGDDAAVVVPGRGAFQVLTTDALVEGVHFDLALSSPADVGYRTLAVNVSDVAAMGGAARVALLSLIVPDTTSSAFVDGLLDGFLELGQQLGVALAGGNIARTSGPICVDVTVVGDVRPRKILTRSGARPGDRLFVTGAVGAAAAGLAWLRAAGGSAPTPDEGTAACVARYRRPEPRARFGGILGRTKAATACMDLSDGLADAVHRIAEASGAGARVDAARVPVHPAAVRLFDAAGRDPLAASIASDDYELLFTASPKLRGRLRAAGRGARGLAITEIGEITETGPPVLLRDGVEEPLPAGFTHF